VRQLKNPPKKERTMLQDLTNQQVEQAFKYLYEQPMSFPPPKELKELNNAEWLVLDQLLQNLPENNLN
jgi:hypothetical protein